MRVVASGTSAESDPEYPLGRLRFPSLTESARPFRLVDLRYRVSDAGSQAHAFEARLKLGAFAFLGGEVIDQRRGLFFDTQRLEIGLTEEEGRYAIEGAYRFERLLFRARADRRPESEGKGWVVGSDLALRLNGDFELLFGFSKDAGRPVPGFLGTRPLHRASAGFLYQREHDLELGLQTSRSRIRTEGGIDFTRDRAEASVTFYRRGFEIHSRWGYEETTGRLQSKQGLAVVSFALELGRYLVVHGTSDNRWEPGVERFERALEAGLTFYGRRHTYARGGEAALRMVDLVRHAYELGYNERRVYDLGGMRALRERLGISPARTELAHEIDGLYRAQVRERNVPQAGFQLSKRTNDVEGVVTTHYEGFIGVPWPPGWPIERKGDSVDFIMLRYSRLEQLFAAGIRAVSQAITMEVALNREMSLRFRWLKPGRTPTEIAKLTSRPRRIDLEYVYAFGR